MSSAGECATVTDAPSSAAPAPPVRKGGVGGGLATSEWWEQYYRQQHDTYWDWYLPNDIVVRTIMEQAREQCGLRTDGETEAEDDEQTSHDAAATSPAQSASAADAARRLASLPCLQLGCGNSEVTAELWEAGLRSMRNVDFSVECIERMRALQRSKGWRCADQTEADVIAGDAATPTNVDGTAAAAADSVAAAALPPPQWPLFEAMDVRSLRYPASSFSLVFDKGTLDCVVLESSDSVASARAMLREVHRVLRPGGVSVCFSLYPPTARARFWIDVLTEEEGGESQQEKDELIEVLHADNPPSHIQTAAWQSIRMVALDCSPLELPNQPHTYLYIAVKR